MNAIRSLISLFLVALLAVSVAGWIWAGGLPPPNMAGARAVLAMCGLSSLLGLGLIWTAKNEPTT
jgi:hypothetical protein